MFDDVDRVQKRAKENGIVCEKPVYRPLHKSLPDFDCPNSDRAYEQALSIPLYPGLTGSEIDYLLQRFRDMFSNCE
jgi:perosamine synthetase